MDHCHNQLITIVYITQLQIVTGIIEKYWYIVS